MKRIRVRVFQRAGRKYFEAQWSDPLTGLKKTKSTGKTTRTEALRVAAKLEADIEEGRFKRQTQTQWSEFWNRYEAEQLASLAVKTRQKARSTYNSVTDLVNPRFVNNLVADQISRFQSRLRASKLAEATIKSHLSALRAALNWGERIGIIEKVPKFQMPRRIQRMKGRAPSREEFERIREKVEEKTSKDTAASWLELIDGLWWSGLRLGEAMALHWTDDSEICVDLSGRRPMFRIQADAEKGNRFRILPMAPEFAEQLQNWSPERRRGFVFNPIGKDDRGRPLLDWVSKMICRFGKAASVKVAERATTDDEGNPVTVVKYASAHDFRRAFGTRWALRVMPVVLQEMMRHETIETTMKYYVGHQAEATAEQMWAAYANGSANTPPAARRTARKNR